MPRPELNIEGERSRPSKPGPLFVVKPVLYLAADIRSGDSSRNHSMPRIRPAARHAGVSHGELQIAISTLPRRTYGVLVGEAFSPTWQRSDYGADSNTLPWLCTTSRPYSLGECGRWAHFRSIPIVYLIDPGWKTRGRLSLGASLALL